jgi:hypothetical protein
VTAFEVKRSDEHLKSRAERMYRVVRDIAVSADRLMRSSPQDCTDWMHLIKIRTETLRDLLTQPGLARDMPNCVALLKATDASETPALCDGAELEIRAVLKQLGSHVAAE